MISKVFKALLRYWAMHGHGTWLYRQVCRPNGEEWAAVLRRGSLNRMGTHCSVQTNVTITDPKYVRLGNNVRLSGCTIFGHDGTVNMINRAYGLNLDRVGGVDIRDNVFIGHQALVMPGVTIGPNAIVAAGAVVTSNVEPHSVYGGVPARRLGGIDELIQRFVADQAKYPWQHLVDQRRTTFDPAIQSLLDEMRVKHFFGEQANKP